MALVNKPTKAAVPAKTAPVATKVAAATPAKPATPVAEKKEVLDTKIFVTRTIIKDGVEADPTNEEHTLEAVKFATDAARVGVGLSLTKNLGNNQFLKVNVYAERPCYTEEMDEATEATIEQAATYLSAAVEQGEVMVGVSAESEPAAEGVAETAEAEGAAETVEEGAEDEEITPETVRSYDRKSLIGLVNTNKLDINPADYPETGELAEAIIAVAFENGAGAEEEAAGEDTEVYDEETLKTFNIDQLKEIYKNWDMPWAHKGPPQLQKTKAIKEIVATYAAAA